MIVVKDCSGHVLCSPCMPELRVFFSLAPKSKIGSYLAQSPVIALALYHLQTDLHVYLIWHFLAAVNTTPTILSTSLSLVIPSKASITQS